MYECVMAMKGHDGRGCILADEMYVAESRSTLYTLTGRFAHRGMGKTLQVCSLVSSLMTPKS